jgi:putative flavoprotein involved in K+ transport
MPTTGTAIIGAGQAGLAASRCLVDRGEEHVVLERGRIGQRWRSDTWDSLNLLSPNWMNTLPRRPYEGHDPDGFISAAAFTDELVDYARSFDSPVLEGTSVQAVELRGGRFQVATDQAVWNARNLVVATGWCDRAAVPALAAAVHGGVHQVASNRYTNPDDLPAGGVLVVGASATGVQLADELARAGRDVTIAVGSHTRVPRTYRGMDIFWWLDRLGVLDRTIDEMTDPYCARREPSLQLVGRKDRSSLDLPALQAEGVHLVGRLTGVDGHRVRLRSDLPGTLADAQRRVDRLLAQVDAHVEANGLGTEVLAAEPMRPVAATPVVEELDLRTAGIRTLVWATGFRRSYPWLGPKVLDRDGEITQRQGRTPVPGLYVLGQRFQHRRSSNFIGGVGRDAADIADSIVGLHPTHHGASRARAGR